MLPSRHPPSPAQNIRMVRQVVLESLGIATVAGTTTVAALQEQAARQESRGAALPPPTPQQALRRELGGVAGNLHSFAGWRGSLLEGGYQLLEGMAAGVGARVTSVEL